MKVIDKTYKLTYVELHKLLKLPKEEKIYNVSRGHKDDLELEMEVKQK